MPPTHPFDQSTSAITAAHALTASIKNRTALVTGCSPDGVGQATAQALAAGGISLLIISARSQSKLDTVAQDLRSNYPKTQVRTLLMDLSSQASVRTAAAEVNAYAEEGIDMLINNAGTMSGGNDKLRRTEEGLEIMFGTNHIGHFLFTNLIMRKLLTAAQTSPPGATRIVNVSSTTHNYSPLRFSDPNFTQGATLDPSEAANWDAITAMMGISPTDGYVPMVGYAQSKTANILFTVALQARLTQRGISSFALHPGVIWSAGATATLTKMGPEMTSKLFLKDLGQGASTSVVAAADPGLVGKGGEGVVYLADCQVGEAKNWATDKGFAERLWGLSEELVGEKFGL